MENEKLAEGNSKRRNLEFNEAFTGKTITRVDTTAVNAVVFYFGDGTSVELNSDYFVPMVNIAEINITK